MTSPIDHVEIMLGISEGQIGGLEHGLKSFYFGDTPFQSQGGTNNFKNCSITMYTGVADPPPVHLMLGGSGSNTPVNTALAADVTVVRTTANSTGVIDALDVRIVINSLSYAGEDGAEAIRVVYRLRYKKSGDTLWTDWDGGSEKSVTALITTPTPYEYRQPVEAYNGTYDIEVKKLSPDSDSKNTCDIAWESFQEISHEDLVFPYTAVAVIEAEASNQFSSVPEMWGVYHGIRCHLPNNYNQYTRTFDGTWNGVFKIGWTNDPAWVLYELVTNPRWGMAAYYPVTIDKYDCYDASVYLSEKIPDGMGGTMPRFSYNRWITDPELGDQLINEVAGSFFGICLPDGKGTYQLRLDRDSDPVRLFTPEMVADGGFSYSHTDLDQRYNKVTAKFKNPDLLWNQDKRVVEDQDDQAINGIIPLELDLPYTASWAEAMRCAYFRMLSSLTETESVSFKTNRMASVLDIFDVILVADPDMDYSLTGRVKSISPDKKTITLRDPLSLESGVTYTAQFEVPAAGIVSQNFTVASSGSFTQIVFGVALNSEVSAFTPFSIGADGVVGLPKPYRVLSAVATEGNADTQDVVALEINRAKFALVDNMDYNDTHNGAASVGDGSVDVVGTGTHWIDDGVKIGQAFSIVGSGVLYQIQKVIDNTHLKLTTKYVVPSGGGTSGLSYGIFDSPRWANRKASTTVGAPTNLAVSNRKETVLGKTHNVLRFTFNQAADQAISRHRVEYTHNGNPPVLLTEILKNNTSFEFHDPPGGDYVFTLYALNRENFKSDSITLNYTVNSVTASPKLPAISGLEIENQNNDTNFYHEDVKFAWRISSGAIVAPDLDDEEAVAGIEALGHDSTFKDYYVQFFDLTTGQAFFSDTAKDCHYRLTYAQNSKALGGPRRSFKIGVTYRNKLGQQGKTQYMTVANPAPAAVSNITFEYGPGTVKLRWPAIDEPDVAYYKVWQGNASGFTPDDGHLVYKGKDNNFIYTAGPGTTAYFKVSAFDRFNDDHNLSNEISVTIPTIAPSFFGNDSILPKALNRNYDLWTPSVGDTTKTIADNKIGLLVFLSTPLALPITVTLPANPSKGQEIVISVNSTLSSFTLAANTGQSIAGTLPTSLTADTPVKYSYDNVNNLWFKV